MIKLNNLIQTLKERSVLPDRGVTFVSGSDTEQFLSYRELFNEAIRGLGLLQEKKIAPQSEIVLQLDDNKDFLISFWACILGGYIPIPVSIGKNDEHKKKLFKIWEQLTNPYLLADTRSLERIRQYADKNEEHTHFKEIEAGFIKKDLLLTHQHPGKCYDTSDDDIAFIQFSSGSTGTPKGIVLTHRNLISNINAIGTKGEYGPQDTLMSWMPLTHDMGLIGFHLCPVYEGIDHVIIDTNLFIRRPSLWLQKSCEHKASVLCSPNFGYRYTLKHTDSNLKSQLDLSHIRLIYNGAEPISENLCNEFLQFFSDCGLAKHVMCPVYGLAEASLAVTMSDLKAHVESVQVDRNKLKVGDQIVRSATDVISLINVGTPVPDCSVRIVDQNGISLPEETVGHIYIKGKNVTAGYYHRESDANKPEGWLDTGDIGVVINGSLHITGRAKDIIFVNGQNYYPHDIEQIAQEIEQVELNKIVVVSHLNSLTDENEIIAFVFHRGKIASFIPIAEQLKSLVNSKLGLDLNLVIPVRNIPRTTSGKLQRFKLLKQYLSGDFEKTVNDLRKLQFEDLGREVTPDQFTDPTEKKIRDIWAKVLKKRNIKRSDSFLEIGGNSLKLAEVGMLIWREFQVELSSDVLFENLTITDLASSVSKVDQKSYLSIPWTEDKDFYPLASAQKRLYFAWKLDQETLAYNNPVAFSIRGKVSHLELNDALNTLIRRNDALRMSFGFSGNPFFKVADPAEVSIHLDEITCSEKDVPAVLRSAVLPFHLEKAPLLRARLLNVEGADPILFLDFHHIIADGISIYNFVDDLFTLCIGDRTSNKAVDYKDFVFWEQSRAKTEELQAQKDFWLKQFSDHVPVLDLPTDRIRPSVFDTRGARIEFTLDQPVTDSLRKLAKENSCTPFVLMLSLYKLLLFKYTGQDEVVVGVPVSGRNHPDLLKLYGMFVNNLAVRGTMQPDDSFIEFLANTKKEIDQSLENQEYPFEALMDDLQLRADPSRNPMFDTMFNYQNMGAPFKSKELKISRYFFDPGFSKFDLSVEFFDQQFGKLSYFFEYTESLFDRDTILDLNECFRNLIKYVLNDPLIKLKNLSLLSPSRQEEIISDGHNSSQTFDKSKTVDQLFRDLVQSNPEAIAVSHGSDRLTYKELYDQVVEKASLLKQHGVKNGTIVGVMLNRSADLIVSILAVLESGGCYLPMDVDSPEERIKYILNDSKAEVLLTDTLHRNRIADWDIGRSGEPSLKLINIDLHYSETSNLPTAEYVGGAIENPAYVIYTSGTTGNPKGVVVGHRSLSNYIQWAARTYTTRESSDFALFTNIAFDLTVTSIFTPLVTGNSIVIFDEGPETSLTQIAESEEVNVIKLTPSHLRMLIEIGKKQFAAKENIKTLIVGGEAFETELAKEANEIFDGNLVIFNEYGPTEATVGCMIHEFNPDSTSSTVSIGVPISNTKTYVLDQFHNLVPPGVRGELYISGDCLAHGYLHREVLTSEKFLENPFAGDQKMYKTGDLVKILSSGELEFISRIDDQVKIRGYRVELTEIIDRIKDIDGIQDAIVILKEIDVNQVLLIGYYTEEIDSRIEELDGQAISTHLIRFLPDYMIPRHFIRLSAFPLTKNGKVDISSLPVPALRQAYVSPTNEMEDALLQIWSEIFDRDDIGIEDNFFDLGGDSIKAVQISSRLFEKGIEVNAKDILRFHSVSQIALQAKAVGNNRYEQKSLEGERRLTPIENWFFAQNFTNPGFFNQSVLLDLHQPIDKKLIGQTLWYLINHHDNLRCNYHIDQQKAFFNNSLEAGDIVVEDIDLTEESQTMEEACRKIKSGIDITSGALLKAGIIRNGDTVHLFLTAHHLVIDGMSWRVLLEDFYQCYQALVKGAIPELPTKTASTQLFVDQLEEEFVNDEADRTHWEQLVSHDFALPEDHDSRVEKSLTGSREKISVGFTEELTGFLLKESHQKYKTDVLTLLTVALTLTLRRWTDKDEFIVEFENHGRHVEGVDVSRTIGWFTAMYPVKLLVDSETLTDHILSVKKQLSDIPGYGLGYGVSKYLKKNENLQNERPSELRFNYLGQFGNELKNDLFSFSENSSGEEIAPENEMTCRLELNLMIIRGALRMEALYSNERFEESTIREFCESFQTELESLADHMRSDEEIHFAPDDFDAVELDDDLLASLLD